MFLEREVAWCPASVGTSGIPSSRCGLGRASTKVVGGEHSLLGESGLPIPGLLLVLNHVHSIHKEKPYFLKSAAL